MTDHVVLLKGCARFACLVTFAISACTAEDQASASAGNETEDQQRIAAQRGALQELFSVPGSPAYEERAVDPGWGRFGVLDRGGHRLVDLQADILGDNAKNGYGDEDPDDGGWDWNVPVEATEHSASPSPENTYGVTALGSLAAYVGGHLRDPRTLTSCLDAYIGMETLPQVDSPPDFAYLTMLSFATGNTGHAELARQKYDTRVASLGGAQQLAESIRDRRTQSGNDGLIPFDLGWLVISAISLEIAFPGQNYFSDAQIYGAVVSDEIRSGDNFNIDDPTEQYYTHGLAWGVTAVSWSLVDVPLALELGHRLLRDQLPSGAWPWNETYSGDNIQATAAAVQNLAFVSWLPKVRRAIRRGARWLADRQLETGGWEYGVGNENTEVDAEVMLALFVSSPVLRGHGHFGKMNKPKDPHDLGHDSGHERKSEDDDGLANGQEVFDPSSRVADERAVDQATTEGSPLVDNLPPLAAPLPL